MNRINLFQTFKSLISDEQGSMAVMMVLSLTAILGFAGMGVDIAMWYQEKRTTQSIADAAAVAAVHADQRGQDFAAMTAAAVTEAARNGYVAGPNNQILVTASAGAPVGSRTPIVDVVVRRAVPRFLMAAFTNQDQVIAAAASGGLLNLGDLCVIGLDYGERGEGLNVTSRNVEFMGNTYVDVACGVHSNSSTGDSLYVGGNATLLANPAQAVGGIQVSGSGVLTIASGGNPIAPTGYQDDPFANRSFPDRAAIETVTCYPGGSLVVNSDTTLDAEAVGGSIRICGDLTVKPGDTLTLTPGVYYVDDGDILIQGNVETPTGGVTIVLTGSSASSVGEIDIRATASVTLTAPDSGDYQGIAFMQDQTADTTGDNKFNGGSALTVTGAIYLKNQQLTYNGGTDSDGCTLIVARKVKFSGNTTTYVRNTGGVCGSVGLGNGASPAQTQVILLQ